MSNHILLRRVIIGAIIVVGVVGMMVWQSFQANNESQASFVNSTSDQPDNSSLKNLSTLNQHRLFFPSAVKESVEDSTINKQGLPAPAQKLQQLLDSANGFPDDFNHEIETADALINDINRQLEVLGLPVLEVDPQSPPQDDEVAQRLQAIQHYLQSQEQSQ